jgi:hypothetical protein
MEKRLLGKTGMMVSAITYGGIVSTDENYEGANLTHGGQDKSDMYVDYAIKSGVNYFDVAPQYGNAQERMGNSLLSYRKEIYLACKTLKRGAEDARKELEESLKLLHTDYFDVYQLHCLETVEEVDVAFSKGGVMEVLLKARAEGVARHLGITCHTEEAAMRALSYYDFDTVLFPMNWALHIKRGFGNQIIQAKKEKNFGLLGIKSMIHRAWFDDDERYSSRYPKSWCRPITDNDPLRIAAMKYALTMGVDTFVPPGNFEQFALAVEHIEECLKNPISEADMELLRSELGSTDGHEFM